MASALGIEAWEREKKGFDSSNGAAGRPGWDDAIEFSLAPAGRNGEFLHQIVTADAVTFQEIATDKQEKRRDSTLPVICKATKHPDRFTVEAAVPLGAGGVPVPKAGERWKVQFMRTRVMPDGQREHSLWTLTESFHDLTRYGTVVFE